MEEEEVENPCIWQADLNNFGIDDWGSLDLPSAKKRRMSAAETHNPYARPWT